MSDDTKKEINKTPDEIRYEAIVQSSQMIGILGAALKNESFNFNLTAEWLESTGSLLVDLGRHIGNEMDGNQNSESENSV